MVDWSEHGSELRRALRQGEVIAAFRKKFSSKFSCIP